MQRVLSFEQTQPLSVPLRFFLSAPLFAVAAALVLLWHGPDAMSSRWSPVTLAFTHLLTLGFLTMCMIGSLMQILPVVGGVDIPHPSRNAGAAHALLTVGTLALASGFLLSAGILLKLALLLLLTAFAWIFAAALRRVWRNPQVSSMLTAVRFALAALAITVGLGLTVGSTFAWSLPLPLTQLTDLHATWGLLGWVGLLVIGIAYQVVPMFQVTALYPKPLMRWLARIAFLLLALWSTADFMAPQAPWSGMLFTIIAGAYITFSLTTLYLLSKRKRPKADPTTLFWRTSLASLLACAAVWCAGALYPGLDTTNAYPLALGVLLIVGFGYSVVNGMLYKIVPFLVWYHLQNRLGDRRIKAPNVKEILPDRDAERQFFAHLVALLLLAAGTLFPEWLSRLAGFAFAISSGWLWLNLFKAARVYQRMTAE